MTRLNYGEVTDIEYVTSEASLVLTPEQQSLAVQAVSAFRALSNWTDGNTEADNIDALVSSTLAALTDTTIPPKENMNNRFFFLPFVSTILLGNRINWIAGTATQAQLPPTNGSTYEIAPITLAAGNWKSRYAVMVNNNTGILRSHIMDYTGGGTVDQDDYDLYSTTQEDRRIDLNAFTLTVDTEVRLRIIAQGKNASSSNYFLPIGGIELIRL